MPRQTFDIKEFKYGIISSLDEEDIPPESASDSLNVDGDAGEGILQGIPTDTEFTVSGGSIADIGNGRFVQAGTEHHLIYHDSNANAICAVMDFYDYASMKKKLTLISGLTAGKQVSLTLNKRQVHIGIKDSTAKYVGYADHGIFNYGTSWTITGCADNGAGLIRVSTDTEHCLNDGDVVKISGVTGTTEANGYWIVSGSFGYDAGATNAYFDLAGSTFTNVYVNGGTATHSLIIEDADCANISGDSSGTIGFPSVGGITEAAAGSGYFGADTYHEWRLSFIYDGIEESPLYAYPSANSFSDTASAEIPYYELQLEAYRANLTAGNTSLPFNRRITAVNIYRADSPSDLSSELGLFRQVLSVSLDSPYWQADVNDRVCYFRDYGNYVVVSTSGGALYTTDYEIISESTTYKDNSGMPETLTSVGMRWGLAAQGSGYHFISLANKVSATAIFRSKNFRYDMFDWTSDFVVLPDYPTALEFYEGRLFAFTAYKTYRINPETLVIEDIFEDAGAQGQRAVHTNEYGLFFGNTLNAWMYNGGTFYRIGDAIRQSASGGKSWGTFLFTTLTNLIVTSDAKKGYVLFINERTDTTTKLFAWAYSPAKKRWDAWSFGGYASSANAGIIKGRDGEVYLSNASKTYKLMRDSGYQLWEWYSQDLTFNAVGQKKSITMIKVDSTGTVSINYGFEGATVNTAYTNETLINERKKSIRIKLNAASGSNYVDSLEVIYRPMIGAR